MIKDMRYIIKKTIIGILITLFIFFFKSYFTFAISLNPYYLSTKKGHFTSTTNYVWINGTSSNGVAKYTQSNYAFYQTNNKGLALSFDGVPNDNKNYTITGQFGTRAQWFPFVYVKGYNERLSNSNQNDIINNSSIVSVCTLSNGNVDTDYSNMLSPDGGFAVTNQVSFNCGGLKGYRYYTLIIESHGSNDIVANWQLWIIDTVTYEEDVIGGSINNLNTQIQNQTTAINNQTQKIEQQTKKIEQQTQVQKETNNLIKDESAPSDSQYSSLSNNNAQNGVINQLITMPITLAQSYLNGFNSSCNPFNLGNLYGADLILPCINPANYLGSIWSVIDVIISGIFIFVFGKKLVKIFNDVTNLKENQVNEVFK